jgi:putative copper export protein
MDVAIRSVHLMAAAVWAGGLVFLGIAAGVARARIPAAERIAFFRSLGRRFAIVSGVAAVLLAASGAQMAADRLPSWSALTDTTYGHLLLWKLGLFALVVVEAAIHSLVLGPRTGRIRERLLAEPDDAGLQSELRRTAAVSGVLSLLMLAQTAAILVLAADLVA